MAGSGGMREPVVLSGLRVVPPVIGFFRDPLRTASRLNRAHGDFIQFRTPISVGRMPSRVIFTASSSHFREILGHPATWRTVNIAAAGRRNHASSRLSRGLVRMRGKRHEYYRRLVMPPLRRARVMEMSESLGQAAESICDRWPTDRPVDLYALSRDMMQRLAARHLFGDSSPQSREVARMISAYVASSWSLPINLFRLDLPGTPYRRFLRRSEALERRILEWAATKRGKTDPRDLLSTVVNSPDEEGRRPSDRVIAGQVPTLFGAAYETCQNALVWLLLLISQHPKIEASLYDEIAGTLGGGDVTLEKVAALPLLDSVVREGLRILPPVPNQFRVATVPTSLSEVELEAGTRAVLSAFVRNRDPSLYDASDRFLPERWDRIDPSPFEYAVFSAGPRACPGFRFGNSVLKVALAAILTRHRIVLEERAEIGYRVTVALTPYPGVPVRLTARGSKTPAPAIRGAIRRLVRFPQ
jgi:cytochrome P450